MCSFDVFLYYQFPTRRDNTKLSYQIILSSWSSYITAISPQRFAWVCNEKKATCYSMVNIMIRSVVSYRGEYWTKLLLDRVPWSIYICMVMYPMISYRSRCVALWYWRYHYGVVLYRNSACLYIVTIVSRVWVNSDRTTCCSIVPVVRD